MRHIRKGQEPPSLLKYRRGRLGGINTVTLGRATLT
jgi:hypothetical protein